MVAYVAYVREVFFVFHGDKKTSRFSCEWSRGKYLKEHLIIPLSLSFMV